MRLYPCSVCKKKELVPTQSNVWNVTGGFTKGVVALQKSCRGYRKIPLSVEVSLCSQSDYQRIRGVIKGSMHSDEPDYVGFLNINLPWMKPLPNLSLMQLRF